MKKIVSTILSFNMLWLVSGCQTATKPISSKDAFQAKLVGVYKGIIASVAIDSPGVTRFTRDGSGNISGTYEYIDENKTTSTGSLKDCRQPGDLILHCQWQDKYGTGDLKITFDADATQFTGNWNMKGSGLRLPWTGAK